MYKSNCDDLLDDQITFKWRLKFYFAIIKAKMKSKYHNVQNNSSCTPDNNYFDDDFEI